MWKHTDGIINFQSKKKNFILLACLAPFQLYMTIHFFFLFIYLFLSLWVWYTVSGVTLIIHTCKETETKVFPYIHFYTQTVYISTYIHICTSTRTWLPWGIWPTSFFASILPNTYDPQYNKQIITMSISFYFWLIFFSNRQLLFFFFFFYLLQFCCYILYKKIKKI